VTLLSVFRVLIQPGVSRAHGMPCSRVPADCRVPAVIGASLPTMGLNSGDGTYQRGIDRIVRRTVTEAKDE